jgi:hypothetical protein
MSDPVSVDAVHDGSPLLCIIDESAEHSAVANRRSDRRPNAQFALGPSVFDRITAIVLAAVGYDIHNRFRGSARGHW